MQPEHTKVMGGGERLFMGWPCKKSHLMQKGESSPQSILKYDRSAIEQTPLSIHRVLKDNSAQQAPEEY